MQKKHRRLLWVLICLAAILALGYGLLPWILPIGLIKEQLAKQMSHDFGREVSIGKLTLGWNAGFEIQDLTIARRVGFGQGYMIRVGKAAGPFSPIGLLRSRLSELAVEDMDINLVINKDGELNISDLEQRLSGGKGAVDIGCVSLADVSACFLDMGCGEVVVFDIARSQFSQNTASSKAEVTLSGSFSHDKNLGEGEAASGGWHKELGLSGQTQVEVALSWAIVEGLTCQAKVDMTETGLAFELPANWQDSIEAKRNKSGRDFVKPVGDELVVNVEVAMEAKSDNVELVELRAVFGGAVIKCKGVLEGVDLVNGFDTSGGVPIRSADLSIMIDAGDLSKPGSWLKPLANIGFGGQVQATTSLALQLSPVVKCHLKPSVLSVASFEADVVDTPIHVRLRDVQLSSHKLVAPAMEFGIGDNKLMVVANMVDPFWSMDDLLSGVATPAGRVEILSEEINVDHLASFFEKLGINESTNATHGGTDTDVDLDVILAVLRRLDITVVIDIGRLVATDAKTGALLKLSELRNDLTLANGQLSSVFCSGLNEGVILGQVSSDLRKDDPNVLLRLTGKELQTNTSLGPMVESEFPGLSVLGTISEEREVRCSLSNLLIGLDDWTGQGVTICKNGVLYGPGGPEWMLKVFPGLELVEYRWKQMTNRYKMLSGMRKKNDLTFEGTTYDIYLNGMTQAVSSESEYDNAMSALAMDSEAAREKIALLDSGRLKMPEGKAKQLRSQLKALKRLWRRHKRQERLSVSVADYVVGGVLILKVAQLIKEPHEVLRVPLFHSHSYIIERSMVGTQVTNVTMAQRSKSNAIYKLIFGKEEE